MSASAALRSIMRRHQGTLENRRLEEASLSRVLKIQVDAESGFVQQQPSLLKEISQFLPKEYSKAPSFHMLTAYFPPMEHLLLTELSISLYSTTLNFGVLPLVEIDHLAR